MKDALGVGREVNKMGTPWIILTAIGALALGYVVVPVTIDAFLRFRRHRIVRCPETGLLATVGLDARHAALTAVPGPPDVRVAACSLWPEKRGCEERCVAPGAGG
jgi:hypothetical protein